MFVSSPLFVKSQRFGVVTTRSPRRLRATPTGRSGAAGSSPRMLLAESASNQIGEAFSLASAHTTSLMTVANESDFGGYFIPAISLIIIGAIILALSPPLRD